MSTRTFRVDAGQPWMGFIARKSCEKKAQGQQERQEKSTWDVLVQSESMLIGKRTLAGTSKRLTCTEVSAQSLAQLDSFR